MKRVNVLVKQHIDFEICNSIDFSMLKHTLRDVSPLYPNFSVWFNFTFRRNILSGERNILIASDGDNILGVSLLKKTHNENKICTFYVPPEYRSMNIGKNLLDKSLSLLDNQNSIITVSDERHDELRPLLVSRGFELSKSVDSLYRKGSSENFYKL